MPITEETGVRAVVAGAAQYVSDSARVNAATGQMVAGVQRAARDSTAAGQSLAQVGLRMRELGSQGIFLGAALTAPAAAALVLAVNFETAMTRISTLSGIAAADIEELKDGLFEISSISAQGPDELARGLLTITSTGKEGAEALAILEASAKASAIGLGETNEIARTITATVTAFASQGLTAAHAADVLFATVREGGAEVADVAGSLGRVVGIAAQVGVSFEDVGAFIATFTRLGVGADEAVTALRGTLTTLINPSEQAATALESAGLSMESLRATAREKGLNEALRLIIEAFRGNEEALADVIPNVRALAGVLGTAGSQAEEFGLVLDALRNSEGDLDKAFEQTAETSAFKFQQAVADIKREIIEASSVLLPALAEILDVVGKVIGVFGSLPAPVVAAGLAMAGLAGIAVTLVSTLGLLLGTVGALTGVGGLAGLTGAAGGAGVALGGIAAAAAPVIAIGAAVAGGIFAAAFLADKLAAEEASAAISELERVKGLADRAAKSPEGPAPADRRAGVETAARRLLLGESEERKLLDLVEKRKALEEDIAKIRAGETVVAKGRFGPAVPRTEAGLQAELGAVNAQIAGRKPRTNLEVSKEELDSLRQLRSELAAESAAMEEAGRSVEAHRTVISGLDEEIRLLEAGVKAGSAAVVAANAEQAGSARELTSAETAQRDAAEALFEAYERSPQIFAERQAAHEAEADAQRELTRLQDSGIASTEELDAAELSLAEAGERVAAAESAAAGAINAISGAAAASVGPVDAAAQAQREYAAALDLVNKREAAADKKAADKAAEANRLRFLDETEALAGGRGANEGPDFRGASADEALKSVEKSRRELEALNKLVAAGAEDISDARVEATRERLAAAERELANATANRPSPTALGTDLSEDQRKQIEEDDDAYWDGRVKSAEEAVREAEAAAREAESSHKRAISESEAAARELEQAFRESIPGRTAEALEQTRKSRLQQQAEAIAREAFGLEGDSLSEVIATQQRSNAAFQAMRDRLLALGEEVPESLLTMFDRMAEVTEDEAKKTGETIGGLLGFLIGKQIGQGRNFRDLVSVPTNVQAQFAASAAQAQGGTVQEINLNGPINIGAGVTTGDVAQGVAVAVRPAMSSL